MSTTRSIINRTGLQSTINEFLKSCESYIGKLQKDGNLKIAQPLVREGSIISGSREKWNIVPFDETKEVQVGYYHILAKDMDDAMQIAKDNPEFEFSYNCKSRSAADQDQRRNDGLHISKVARKMLIAGLLDEVVTGPIFFVRLFNVY